jgi:hypothetical protein
MTKINLHSGNYLFVEKDSEIAIHVSPKVSIEIFNKEYKYLSTTKDITEEQVVKLVDKCFPFDNDMTMYFKDYGGYKFLKTAKESLQSLIQVNGLDINKNYLILKKL